MDSVTGSKRLWLMQGRSQASKSSIRAARPSPTGTPVARRTTNLWHVSMTASATLPSENAAVFVSSDHHLIVAVSRLERLSARRSMNISLDRPLYVAASRSASACAEEPTPWRIAGDPV